MTKKNQNEADNIVKKKYIGEMFDDIASNYDFLNHLLSFGIDRYWRKQVVKKINQYNPKNMLDVATGTGDLAISISKLQVNKIVGIDISEKMLAIGQNKIKKKS